MPSSTEATLPAWCSSIPRRRSTTRRKEIVEATDPESSENIEKRDYLRIEKDAWAGRRRIGDIPVSIMSVRFFIGRDQGIALLGRAKGDEADVKRQRRGWFVLSPRAKQLVTHGGHAVEENDPELVVKTIVGVVKAAR